MKSALLFRVAICAAATTAAAPLASAQPGPETRDHRHDHDPRPPADPPPAPPAPPDHGHDHDHGHGLRISGFEPGSAAVGATVTVHGDNFPGDAVVIINGQRAAATRVDDHTLTFAVPQLPPGRFDIQIESRGHRDSAGSLEVLPMGAPPIVPPRDHGGPGDHGHHHDWHIDRPTISSYWPAKGDIGTVVTIRGVNFAADTTVLWGGNPIAGASVSPTEISFKVPRGAASGDLSLHSGGMRRDLPIGAFEVAAHWDPMADRRHREDEWHRHAQDEWNARQSQIAKDKAARDAELARQQQELANSREQRRQQWLAEVRAKFQAAFLADAETQSELTLHAQRSADLARMNRLAENMADGKLAVRVQVLIQKENDRHDQRMAALEAAFRSKGGAP